MFLLCLNGILSSIKWPRSHEVFVLFQSHCSSDLSFLPLCYRCLVPSPSPPFTKIYHQFSKRLRSRNSDLTLILLHQYSSIFHLDPKEILLIKQKRCAGPHAPFTPAVTSAATSLEAAIDTWPGSVNSITELLSSLRSVGIVRLVGIWRSVGRGWRRRRQRRKGGWRGPFRRLIAEYEKELEWEESLRWDVGDSDYLGYDWNWWIMKIRLSRYD